MKSRVCILEISFVSDIEYYSDLINMVRSKINRPNKAAKYTKASISLIVETDERLDSLLGRLFEIIDKEDVADAWVYEITDAAGLDGQWCDFSKAVKISMLHAGERGKPKDMSPRHLTAKPFTEPGIRQTEKGATIEVAVKGSRLKKAAG